MLTLEQVNCASPEAMSLMLNGVYEQAPWVMQVAQAQRPFKSLAHLKYILARVVSEADRESRLALVRGHPELAGKALMRGTLTVESSGEQSRSGLTHCTVDEFSRLGELNAAYRAKFDFPFVLAVRGPRGSGLNRQQVIEEFSRRLDGPPEFELAECLRHVNRIAEMRLDDKFGVTPTDGNLVWDWAEALATHSDPPFADAGQLTVTYLTPAHQSCARQLLDWMRQCGFDEVGIDAVGNVWGRYFAEGTQAASGDPAGSHRAGAAPETRTLYTGSHFDTVRNAGKYDGRLGILVPMVVVRRLASEGVRLPFHLEVIGFAEEEGQRYRTSFLGSSAVIGQFDSRWLDQVDADGISMQDAMRAVGLDPAAIPSCRRDPAGALGFIEVHIEQGPVLDELDLPLGVVTAINGSVRFAVEIIGTASHAGTTPMNRRRDAAGGAAELALFLERRAADDGDSVGTIGVLEVPAGSPNVVPGRCRFTLDLRAPRNDQRDRLAADVLAELNSVCDRRNLQCTIEETMRVSAAPSHLEWQRRWEQAVASLGLPVHRLPSGAGHDAMKLHAVMPQAMLFVRGCNSGISHNPLESITAHDAQLCIDAFKNYLDQLAAQTNGARSGAPGR